MSRMESPKWLQVFGHAFWCKKVWGMETPLVIDQAWAGLPRLVAAKKTWIQPILTKQFFKHFLLATTFFQVKHLPVLTAFVYKTIAAQTNFKKDPFKPLDCRKFKKEISPGLGPPSQVHSFNLKESGWQQNKTTNKNTLTPIHTHEQPWTSMGTHEHLSVHEHPWTHMNSCFFPNTMQLANYLFSHMSHSFWALILGCWLCEFLIHCSFLELDIISIFMFCVFVALSCGSFASWTNPFWFLQNIILIYIYICAYKYM